MSYNPPLTELGTHRDELRYFAGHKAERSCVKRRLGWLYSP